MLRRDFLTLPATAPLVAAPGFDPLLAAPRPDPRVAVFHLSSNQPLAEAERLSSRHLWPAPLKIDARPHPAWWPSPTELPDRWQAWLEMPGGWSVLLLAQSARTHAAAAPWPGRLARRLAVALTSAVPLAS